MKTGKEEVVEEVPCVLLAEMMEVGGSIGWQVYWIGRGLALWSLSVWGLFADWLQRRGETQLVVVTWGELAFPGTYFWITGEEAGGSLKSR